MSSEKIKNNSKFPFKWVRLRFKANYQDSRPIKFPPLGPYWESSLSCDKTHAIVIAYLPYNARFQLWDFWPEAIDIQITREKELIFTERFPCPEWWSENER